MTTKKGKEKPFMQIYTMNHYLKIGPKSINHQRSEANSFLKKNKLLKVTT